MLPRSELGYMLSMDIKPTTGHLSLVVESAACFRFAVMFEQSSLQSASLSLRNVVSAIDALLLITVVLDDPKTSSYFSCLPYGKCCSLPKTIYKVLSTTFARLTVRESLRA